MNCIITAGPTYEPLDEVRRLINFSTGQLGSELGNYLVGQGHHVTLLLGQQATWRGEAHAQEIVTFATTADLRARLQSLAAKPVEALFHAAAVSDFTFGKVWRRVGSDLQEVRAGKFSSREGQLLAELVPAAKIISDLRTWFPRARLVGWKYEVEGGRQDAITEAENQILASRTDICVVNGPAYGSGFGLVTGPHGCRHLEDSVRLFAALDDSLREAGGALS